ncbi:F151B protein, partial [Cephalopterus ornatus]|nr:F151B protein [Cephalopterus ornatus]
SLDAVGPSLELLGQVEQQLRRPVWINGDILAGPGGSRPALNAQSILSTVTSTFPSVTLSLGWTTGWHGHDHGQVLFPVGYELGMVEEMSQLCQALSQPVTFPVRAVLVPRSLPALRWLIQQSDRYSLTVWTGKDDIYSVEDLLSIRESFDKSRVYYDIFEPQNSEFKKAIGI